MIEFLFKTEKCSPKILRWRLQLQEFNFDVQFCKGTENTAADCLTRISSLESEEASFLVNDSEISNAQCFDTEVKSMINAINKKFNHKPESVSLETWRLRNDLIVENNILKTSSGKMFVPYKMRLKVLTIGHKIHHGINQTIERLKSKFFWPNLRTEVKNFIENCRTCALVRPKFLPSSSTPIVTKAPMEVVACDFIGPLPSDNNCKYAFVMIDAYSREPSSFPVA